MRQKLLDLYFKLDAYPEVPAMLKTLKDAGLKTAILSNGSPEMLKAAVDNAGIGNVLDEALSVEDLGIFKPHFSVYQMAVDRLGVEAKRVCFMSSNGWDAAGARPGAHRAAAGTHDDAHARHRRRTVTGCWERR